MRTRASIHFILCSFAAAAILTSCGGSGGFKTDEATGIQYKFIHHSDTGAKPVEGDIVHASMLWTGKNAKGDADSVYLNSHSKERGGDSVGAIMFQLRKWFKGCLEEGIMMMTPGDSAVFKVNADSMFMKMRQMPADKVPACVKNSGTFTFSIKLIGFQNQKEMRAKQQAMMEERMKAAQANKMKEPEDIADYLKKNNYNAKPGVDSVFFLQATKGKGKPVKEGDSIDVQYKGMFMDGNVFDPGNQHLKMVYAKDMHLIKGMIDVLGQMNEGEKAKVLIPSAVGYGAMGRGPIQPFTPLVFDLEIVKVKANK